MYGNAIVAWWVKIAGTKSTTAIAAAIALTRIRPVNTPRREEQVAERPAGENADHAADADDEQHERPERLVDRVLTRDELDAEGLHA